MNAPAVVAGFRAATGLSQTDVGALAGWSGAALGYYERGRRSTVFDIRVLLGFADAVAMPREALLPLVLGDTDVALSADSAASESGVDVDRRSFGGLAAGAALAAMLPEAAAPSRVTASHIKYLQASADTLHAQDHMVGGSALLRPALRQWQLARRMLKQSSYTEVTGRQLQVAAGYLANLSGWFAFDTSNLRLARQLHEEALDLATSAEDPVLTAWVLNRLSSLSCYQAEKSRESNASPASRTAAHEALVLINRAADEARYEPLPGLHVVIAGRQACAASLVGNTAAFQAAITRAWREADRTPGMDQPRWLQLEPGGEDLIIEQQARGAANLGDLVRAESLYRMLLDRDPTPRACAFLGARLAGIQLAQTDRHGAIATGLSVLKILEGGVASTRTLNELQPVRTAAAKSGDEEFCARFDAAERALTAA
ncbi:MAG: helix-turn-helix domain-containing protein [Streptosporangiaceae bacterium]|nr:helix-turn-helix domain-containing protein [Streptosporangiaceae bacterium]